MHSMVPYHDFFGRQQERFDPFSLYFWDDFPHDFPFRAPLMARPPFLLSQMRPVARTKIEHKETPEAHHFIAELPGVRKEDVRVQVQDGKMLHISAKQQHEKEEKKDQYYHAERGYGEFQTRFMLPPNTKPEHMRSCVENGVITITLPKENIDMANRGHQY